MNRNVSNLHLCGCFHKNIDFVLSEVYSSPHNKDNNRHSLSSNFSLTTVSFFFFFLYIKSESLRTMTETFAKIDIRNIVTYILWISAAWKLSTYNSLFTWILFHMKCVLNIEKLKTVICMCFFQKRKILNIFFIYVAFQSFKFFCCIFFRQSWIFLVYKSFLL